jgi:hypothetical protein
MTDDAIPDLIHVDERSKRKTVEFCSTERDGYRCMLVRGHRGLHEAVGSIGPLRRLDAESP